MSEEYEADNVTVTVTVEWTQQAAEMYNVIVSPPALIMFTSLKLVLEYNTEYNASIEVVISCGFSTAGFTTLNYGEAYCSYIAHNDYFIHCVLQPCTLGLILLTSSYLCDIIIIYINLSIEQSYTYILF